MTYPGASTFPGLLTFPGTWELAWPPPGIVPVSVAPRPQVPVSVAPGGSVPARVPWRPRVDVEIPLAVSLSVRSFPEMRADVAVPLNLRVQYVADATGGSVAITVPVSMPVSVSAGRVPFFAPVVSVPVDVQVEATKLPAKFRTSGLTKSGNFTLSSTNTWYTVPNWSVRTGFPDTEIVSNGVRVPDQAEISISGQLTYGSTDSVSGSGMQMRVMAGATQIGAAAATPGNSAVAALAPFTWKNTTGGDVIVTVQGRTNSTLGSREIVLGGDGSWVEMRPVVPLVTRAADDFNRPNGSLGSNWVTTGGGTLKIANGRVDGIGTPSVPLSYAWWHQPMPSDTQVVRAVVRWDGMDPEHSACGVVVRANPSGTPTAPGRQFGVQFSWTRSIMALYFEDYNAPNGFTPVTGVAQYVSTSKFPDGAIVELRAEGNLYTALVNGVVQLQGTVASSVIPFSNRYVGVTIQDDSAVQNGGGPPGRLDDFEALTPEE